MLDVLNSLNSFLGPTELGAIIVSLVSGVIVELTFQVIEGKNIDFDQYFNYYPVSVLTNMKTTPLFRYAAFRYLPAILILILNASLIGQYFAQSGIAYSLVVIFVSLASRDIYALFSPRIFRNRKVVYLINIFILSAFAIVIGHLSKFINFSILAPSISGTIDGLWTALFASILYLIFWRLTRVKNVDNSSNDEAPDFMITRVGYLDLRRDRKVIKVYGRIFGVYGRQIDESCKKHECRKLLLYSILIYESLNRPPLFRFIEQILVRMTSAEFTVGIAQVSSTESLNNEESIDKAASLLKGTHSLDISEQSQIRKALSIYNDTNSYAFEIYEIMLVLLSSVYMRPEDF